MLATPETRTVGGLLRLKKAKMLVANPEYQRGEVWTVTQKKRLIDSVLRGYPIPLIYLHHIKTEIEGAKREDFEVIDGQQRIAALDDFKEGAFRLFDPVKDEEEARFPSFIREQPCPWGGKRFEELAPELQDKFLETPLSVVMIQTDVPNEARDLFIRLQAGMPLNSQEKRDAWPGNFTEFVLRIGGKPLIAKYPGHDFFSVVMKASKANRGDFRQLAAQMIMLLIVRRESGSDRLCDINRDEIDDFYYKHLDFDPAGPEARRIREVLDLLCELLGDGKRSKVVRHEAIHLALLVDSLLDDYTRGWTQHFAAAFDHFRAQVAKAKKQQYDPNPPEHWLRYAQLTRVNSDRAETIARRHQFFVEQMFPRLSLVLKDPVRLFGPVERELIYFRDQKRCQVCDAEVLWGDHEVHHVTEHHKGGATTLDNGALVHKQCHPKGAAQSSEFARKWAEKMGGAG